MYTKTELIEILANETGLDFDEVTVMYSEMFGNAENVAIDTAHNILLSI